MVRRAGAIRPPAAAEVGFEPARLFPVAHVSEHSRRRVAVVAGDDQPPPRRHVLHHFPERIGGQALRGLAAGTLEEAYRIEARLSRAVLQSNDAREGPLAFTEKRAPSWTGT